MDLACQRDVPDEKVRPSFCVKGLSVMRDGDGFKKASLEAPEALDCHMEVPCEKVLPPF